MDEQKSAKPKKRKNIFKIMLISIAGLILLATGGMYLYSRHLLNQVNVQPLPKSDYELGIDVKEYPPEKQPKTEDQPKPEEPPQPPRIKHNVTNILMLGVDKEENVSDSMIVLTIDETAKTIKMTSLLRDTHVNFGTGKMNKLNYAYNYGGAINSVKIVNQTFRLDIRSYMKVDFGGLSNIIDVVGGVRINVKSEEVEALNSHSKNVAAIEGKTYKAITSAGMQTLNGVQAVGYSRIRQVGNHDYERTQRQRRVLNAVFDKLKDIPITDYPRVLSQIAPQLETSMKGDELLSLGSKIALYGRNGIQEARAPFDGYRWDSTVNGFYSIKWDIEKNIELLHDFIYYK